MSLGFYGLADHAVRWTFLILISLCDPAHPAVRAALVALCGLVAHALHAVRGGCFSLLVVFMVLLIIQFAVHFLALAV